jgi:hypothetical protein
MFKRSLLAFAIFSTLSTQALCTTTIVHDEDTLRQAIDLASFDPTIEEIIFTKNAQINLTAPVIYYGEQPLVLIGRGATIDGSAAGGFILDDDLTAVTEDGTLVFNTASDITIRNLNIVNSATRGIVVNIPNGATGDDISINLHRVNITNSALYGLHIDDNSDAFDDGSFGSSIGIDLKISHSSFTYNGTGAIDFDGVRVDERADGDIYTFISNTIIDSNGGDGIELDEAGEGNVEAFMNRVSINGNGFYNEDDLDDGFDIDEADDGNIQAYLTNINVNLNMDEGLDFDEAGDGSVELKLKRITANNNTDEGIKVDEEDAGHIEAQLKRVHVEGNGDDGIQFTESGEGKIDTVLKRITAIENDKYGIKLEQWFVEDEEEPAEDHGWLKAKNIDLNGNGKGDEIKTNNISSR